MKALLSALTLLVLFVVAPCARGDVDAVVTGGTGSLTKDIDEVSAGVWEVKLVCVSEIGGNLAIAVQADEEDIISFIWVESNSVNGGGHVTVTVGGKPGTSGRVVRLGDFDVRSDDQVSDGEVWIDEIIVLKTSGGSQGNIGTAGTTPGGVIECHRFQRLEAAGNITARIAGLETLDEGPFGTIVAGGGLFNDVRPYGPLIGLGSIERIDVGGDIGTSSSPVTIWAVGDIGTVIADNIFATILAADRFSAFFADIRRVETRDGNFDGFLGCKTFSDDAPGTGDVGVFVAGDFDGIVGVADDFEEGVIEVGGDLLADSCIKIGGSLSGSLDHTITFGAGGLKGQVIVNSLNDGGSWVDGVVIVGSTTLSTVPYYAQTGLGGGAVGLAPFNLHGPDCTPPSCTVIFEVEDGVIVLRHYGPVDWDEEFMPVTVEWSTVINWNCPPSNTSWVDVTDKFTVDERDPDNPREVVVRALDPGNHFATGTIYRVKPVRSGAAMLKCLNVIGAPAVADYTYFIIVDD